MLEIKNASLLNIEELHFLFEQYLDFYKIKAAGQISRQFLTERLKQKDSLILLAYDNQEAAGFVQIYPSFSSVALKPIWILNDLFVAPLNRKKGVAKKLLQELELLAKRRNIFSIKLATAVDNDQAKNLYRSLDYMINEKFELYSKRII